MARSMYDYSQHCLRVRAFPFLFRLGRGRVGVSRLPPVVGVRACGEPVGVERLPLPPGMGGLGTHTRTFIVALSE
jgi:hypothetical protein